VLSRFIGIRLALVLFVPAEPSSDGAWYFGRAITIAEEGSIRKWATHSVLAVGYPAFLSLLFTPTGPKLIAAQFANIFSPLPASRYFLNL
jgi:hypothetical protein